jgi:hypothetical protein
MTASVRAILRFPFRDRFIIFLGGASKKLCKKPQRLPWRNGHYLYIGGLMTVTRKNSRRIL